MPTLDPPDDSLRKMLSELELPDPDTTTSVAVLSDVELLRRYHAHTQKLLEIGEALHPKTQVGRDLHSERGAFQVELHRRRII